MDDWSLDGAEEEGNRGLMISRGRVRGLTRIAGVAMSSTDHPECIDSDTFDCNACEFFGPTTCPLLHDTDQWDGLRSLWAGYNERQQQYEDRRQLYETKRVAARKTTHQELLAHGRPLHYTKLAPMLMDRHPELELKPENVLRILQKNADLFECVNPGVYRALAL